MLNPAPANAPGYDPVTHQSGAIYADHSVRDTFVFIATGEGLGFVGGRVAAYVGSKIAAGLATRALASELEEGGSFLMTEEQYLEHIAGVQPSLYAGRIDSGGTQFMISTPEMNRLIAETGGDVTALAKRLGQEKSWGPGTKLVRVNVTDVYRFNPRFPTSSTPGANIQFKPGGLTSGGAHEIVTDAIPWQNFTAYPLNLK